MEKYRKLGACLAMMFCLTGILGFQSTVYSYSNPDGSIKNVSGFDPYDPLSWNQYDSKNMPESWLGSKMLDGSTGIPFPEGGDFIYVYTFLALKTGFKQPGYMPSFANADLEYYHAYASGLPHLGAEGIFPEDWKADLTSEGSQYQTGKTLEDVKKKWFEGKLVVMQVRNDDYRQTGGSHFIAVDYIDTKNDEIYIFDSTKPALKFSDVYTNDDLISIITLSSSENKSYELPALGYNRGSLNLFSKDGKRDPSTLGGGGATIPDEKIAASAAADMARKEVDKKEKEKSEEETNKLIEEKSSEMSSKNVDKSFHWMFIAIPLALSLSGIGAFTWYRLKNKHY